MMAKRWRKAYLILLLLCVTARLFTGAAEAQVNFLGILAAPVNTNGIVQAASSESLGVIGPRFIDRSDASSIPENHSDYQLYKKYIMPNGLFNIAENYFFKLEQLFISIQATSLYIKDLTLRSLHSNSPPVPVTTLFLIVFMCFLISRSGVFGNYGEGKSFGDWRFSLQ